MEFPNSKTLKKWGLESKRERKRESFCCCWEGSGDQEPAAFVVVFVSDGFTQNEFFPYL